MTEDEMVGWHHQLCGHEFEQAPGVGDRQGTLTCCSPWGCKELGMTDSKDMGLSKHQEMVKDRDAWRAAVRGITKSGT